MPIEVTMPKLSPTMESGVLSQWLVKVGDQVKEGDLLADIETDKATMPMKAFDDGVVAHLDYAVGDEIQLGDRVLVLARKGEDAKQVAAGLSSKKAAGASKPKSAANGSDQPEAQHGAGSNGQDAHEAAEVVAVAAQGGASQGGRIKSSPLARKIAAASQVDLGSVPGSGPGGRVIRDDVELFLKTRGSAAAPAARPAAPTRTLAAERIPHTRMRKTIAQRMVEAKKVAPEIHVTVDIRADALVAVREQLNKQLAPEKIKLSLGDFVTKGVALALRRHPGVNASYEPDAIVRHGEVNVGIAVALDGGLIVPVLRNADTLGLREVRLGSDALVQAARSNKLSPEQMSGGTFTISNLGMYGVRQFDAILNLPEVAILAVGAAEKRPVVQGDSLVVGTVMTVTLTADHRAVDGALAAEFLRTLKGFLEEPASMLL
ncbi:dihydrolipoamide acetyltransferase family protein [Singulisphaera acidiphila]|uniref:Dihydrolipoamide acetyltransferase component of pyruvate dehydrogenase complex n=1 Tax=Singulisphaera acidiphila (strain ATCC BAA-1392 / DSM 18658 / VKM B-2454 / MOB10) TaxID=886293 RepID=L0DP43_SINAD|nr:dihydrolipoamide acetyltransferase family protein [Singulisphaera acidiphila]AGA30623.1 pyruvate/2-oxoglutarate dehydrogenase complex, dihydrolipoamide acyltransferase component [Singulisphaera acidiphila DSM 18658]